MPHLKLYSNYLLNAIYLQVYQNILMQCCMDPQIKQPNDRELAASPRRQVLLAHVHESKDLRETEKSCRKRSGELSRTEYLAGNKRDQ